MTLSLYFARRFLAMFALVFTIFLGILWLIETIEVLRKYASTGIAMTDALFLAVLTTPESLYRILPLLMMLSSVALFLNLARTSELVVVRAAGRSGLAFLVAPLVTALLIGVFAVAVFNPLVAASTKRHAQLTSNLSVSGGNSLSITADGIWMRQANEAGQSIIKAGKSSPDGTVLTEISILSFGQDGAMTSRIEAATATLDVGAWRLAGAKTWDLQSQNPERSAQVALTDIDFPTDLTPERIRDGLGSANAISVWQLPAFIADLEKAGFSSRTQQVWLQMELALPLILSAMVLIAAGFTMRHARSGKTGTMIMFALMGGFFIFFLRNFAQVLGESGQIPLILAAWSAPVAAIMLALALLLHMEDG
ncbi:MAG: LPS export ABC transporter permease LptG [Microgenomates group bacterium]